MNLKSKKSKFKRTVVLTLATLCAISSMGLFSASANNYTDTEGTYPVGGYAWRWTDAARTKEDTSSSYQKCISSTCTYYSWVYASNYASPQNLSQLNCHPTDPKTGKITPQYTFSTGTTRYMINYVRENKYPRAGMMFWTGSTTTGSTHILWSPDSI